MRKTLGIILIIIGWLLAFMTLMSAIPLLIRMSVQRALDAYGIGYLIGTFFFYFILGTISFFIVRKGLQLVKKKKETNIIEKIESIN